MRRRYSSSASTGPRLNDETAERLLKSPEIKKYRHYLEMARRYKPHQLSEIEEQLLTEISPVGISSWHRLFGAILSQMKFGEKGKERGGGSGRPIQPRQRRVRSEAASNELTEGLKGTAPHPDPYI